MNKFTFSLLFALVLFFLGVNIFYNVYEDVDSPEKIEKIITYHPTAAKPNENIKLSKKTIIHEDNTVEIIYEETVLSDEELKEFESVLSE